MSKNFKMDESYVEVSERIVAFREKYPSGSLQAEILRYPQEGFNFIVVKGYAYRTPDDERPGIGHAQEPCPGRTPYTKDSELQNAETSAWGRAIVAALAADTKRGIASADEVRARRSSEAESMRDRDPRETGSPSSAPPPRSSGRGGGDPEPPSEKSGAPASSPGHAIKDAVDKGRVANDKTVTKNRVLIAANAVCKRHDFEAGVLDFDAVLNLPDDLLSELAADLGIAQGALV